MKLLFASITLLTTLAIFTHADTDGDTVVIYENGQVDYIDHTDCIAFEKGDLTVLTIQFGVSVKCHVFDSADCSGDSIEGVELSFESAKNIYSDDFGDVYPHGSLQCETQSNTS